MNKKQFKNWMAKKGYPLRSYKKLIKRYKARLAINSLNQMAVINAQQFRDMESKTNQLSKATELFRVAINANLKDQGHKEIA